MQRYFLSFALLAAALPVAANAREASPRTAEIQDQLRDPARQQRMALMLQAATEILLDMPIAPLAEAAANAAGERARKIDPDLTLRQLAPRSDRMGRDVARTVPRAMDAAGSLAEGVAAMTPMLEEMAARVRRDMLPEE